MSTLDNPLVVNMDRFRFPVVFIAGLSMIGLIDAGVFFRSVAADPALEPVMKDLTEYPFAAYFLGVVLVTPLMGAAWALWYHYRPPMLEKMRHFSIGRISLLVAVIFLGNVAMIMTFPDLSKAGDPALERMFRHHFTALNSPLVAIPLVAIAGWGLGWVFKDHAEPPPGVDRLLVYALSIGDLAGLAIITINRVAEGPFPLPF